MLLPPSCDTAVVTFADESEQESTFAKWDLSGALAHEFEPPVSDFWKRVVRESAPHPTTISEAAVHDSSLLATGAGIGTGNAGRQFSSLQTFDQYPPENIQVDLPTAVDQIYARVVGTGFFLGGSGEQGTSLLFDNPVVVAGGVLTTVFQGSVLTSPSGIILTCAHVETSPMTQVQSISIPEIDSIIAFARSMDSIPPGDASEHALVRIYEVIDDLLNADMGAECDSVLRNVDIETANTDMLLAFLMATASIPKNEVPYRDEFYQKTWNRLESEVGLPETQELLDPLK